MPRQALTALAILAALIASVVALPDIDASEPPDGSIVTFDPWEGVRQCASNGDYGAAAGAYGITPDTQADAAEAANRPDLADTPAHLLSPSQQDVLAELVRNKLGLSRLDCAWAYARCPVTTDLATWCYQQPPSSVTPPADGDPVVIVDTLIAGCASTVTSSHSCVQRWECSPRLAAIINEHGGSLPYSLAVVGMDGLCNRIATISGLLPVSVPAGTPEAPTLAFTG